MFVVVSLGGKMHLGTMCALMEIIWEVTGSPTDREMDLNTGSEIVPVYDKTCALNREFQREICFEPFVIINSLREEIKRTFKW